MSRGRKGSGIEIRDNNIQVRFLYRGKRHRERFNLKPTASNLKAAERMRAEIVKEIELGLFDYTRWFPHSKQAAILSPTRTLDQSPEGYTFAEIARNMMHIYGQNWHKKTKTLYQWALENHWYPKFATDDIRTLDTELVALRVAEINWNQVSAKTRNNMLIVLRAVFRYALETKRLPYMPTALLKNQRVRARKADPLSIEEVSMLLNFLAEHRREEILNYVQFALFTGLRGEEQIALKWGDIDFVHGTAHIERAFSAGEMKETKTGEERDVELCAEALRALQAQKSYTFLAGDFIFVSPEGKPYTSSKTLGEKTWNWALKKLGLRHRNFYQTRHTYATLNLMAGAQIAWIAKQLGNSPELCSRVYAKWIDRADRSRELNKLAGYLREQGFSAIRAEKGQGSIHTEFAPNRPEFAPNLPRNESAESKTSTKSSVKVVGGIGLERKTGNLKG